MDQSISSKDLIAELENLLARPDWLADDDEGKNLRKATVAKLDALKKMLDAQDPDLSRLDQRYQKLIHERYSLIEARSSGVEQPLPPADAASVSAPATEQSSAIEPARLSSLALLAERAASAAPPDPADGDGAGDLTALDKPGPFGSALRAIQEQGRFKLLRQLRTGHFGTGFIAHDTRSGQSVVVKLPAQGDWGARFDECASALRAEAELLEEVYKALQPGADGAARVVQPIGSFALALKSWPQPVPYTVQAHARGNPISDLGILPLRDQGEPLGLRILLQVTGLVLALYEHEFAHRDLKPDCLFLDRSSSQIMVIDWNRARKNPGEDDLRQEFDALRRLVYAVLVEYNLLAITRQIPAADLFGRFRGAPLSRGTRLLLMRLLDPTPPSNAIRTVAELHAALQEMNDSWQAHDPVPALVDSTPEARSCRLSRLAVEVQRPAANSPEANRAELYEQELAETDRQMRGVLITWAERPEAMRVGLSRIEQQWAWLPDAWPLVWIVPLVRDWFETQPRERDSLLKRLVLFVLDRQLDAFRVLAKPLEPGSPEVVRRHLATLATVLSAYQELDLITATAIEEAPVEVLHRVRRLEEVIPSEPRLQRLRQQIEARSEQLVRLGDLLRRADALRALPPDSLRQQALLVVLHELHLLGYDDPLLVHQADQVEQISAAAADLRQAEAHSAADEWSATVAALARWCEPATAEDLRKIAPDLAARIAALAETADRQVMLHPFTAAFRRLEAALAAGRIAEAEPLLREVERTLAAIDAAGRETLVAEQSRRMLAALPVELRGLLDQFERLRRGEYRAARAAKPPQAPWLQGPAEQLEELAECAARLPDVDQPQQAWDLLMRIDERQMRTLPEAVADLWRTLLDRARARWAELLIAALERRPGPADEELARYQDMIETVGSRQEDGLGLRYAAALIEGLRMQREAERSLDERRSLDRSIVEVKAQLDTLLASVDSLTKAQSATPSGEEQHAQAQDRPSDRSRSLDQPADLLGQKPYARDLDAVPAGETMVVALAARSDRGTPEPVAKAPDQAAPVAGSETMVGAPAARSDRGTPEPVAKESDWTDAATASRWWPRWPLQREPSRWVAFGLVAAVVVLALGLGLSRMISRGESPAQQTSVAQSMSAADQTATALAVETPSGIPTAVIAVLASPAPSSAPVSPTLEITPTEIHRLPAEIVVRHANVGKTIAASLKIGTSTIALTSTQSIDTGDLKVFLPYTLMSDIDVPFDHELAVQLILDSRPVMAVKLKDPAVQVRGVVLSRAGLPDDVQPEGAYLWKERDQAKHHAPQGAVKLTGVSDEQAIFVLLQDGDSVKIIMADREFYKVRVVTNQADAQSLGKIKEGWVRRQIVDGAPERASQEQPHAPGR